MVNIFLERFSSLLPCIGNLCDVLSCGATILSLITFLLALRVKANVRTVISRKDLYDKKEKIITILETYTYIFSSKNISSKTRINMYIFIASIYSGYLETFNFLTKISFKLLLWNLKLNKNLYLKPLIIDQLNFLRKRIAKEADKSWQKI